MQFVEQSTIFINDNLFYWSYVFQVILQIFCVFPIIAPHEIIAPHYGIITMIWEL